MKSVSDVKQPIKAWLIYPFDVFKDKREVKKQLRELRRLYPEMGYKAGKFLIQKVKK